MSNLKLLREKLKKALDKDKVDYNQILLLSTKLAQQDEEFVRFTIDASHINVLGLQLVAKQETALAELVKNAYDADATKVKLVFRNSHKPGGRLDIYDIGTGMTRNQLIDGFMRLSTKDKINNPISKLYKRKRAGRKGIGRFAAQRLGIKLTVKTKTQNSPHGWKVTIDWSNFEANRELITIANRIEADFKFKKRSGTNLIIESLRDAWSDEQIRRAYRYVSELLQPFPLSKTNQHETEDPGFKTVFYRKVRDELITITDEEMSIFKHALTQIDGKIDGEGNAFWSLKSQRFKLQQKDLRIGPEREAPYSKYEDLRNIRFKAYYFIPLAEYLPRTMNSTIRQMLREKGGIRLYRNGFRVLPYGELYNDWLRLDASSRLREILPPHSNQNFLGFVEIIDPDDQLFAETSSREGLVENKAFLELQDFVPRVLKKAVLEIASVRGKKTRSSQRKPSDKSPKETAQQLAQDVEDLVQVASREEEKDKAEEEAEEIKDRILEFGELSQKFLEEGAMYRILASLGLAIGKFTHEIMHILAGMVANVTRLITRISSDKEANDALKGLKDNLFDLQAFAGYFDDAIIDSVHRVLQPIELRDIINVFEKIALPELKRNSIELDKDISGYYLWTKPMHKSEWISILLNFYTNSLKAIKRANVKGKLLIRVGEEDKHLFLEFADNGDGIPPENQEKIFDAFFTTSSPPSSLSPESEQMTGSGLGLKIVKDTVESAEGEVYLVTAPKGYSTCFHIDIPKAKDEEIPEYAY